MSELVKLELPPGLSRRGTIYQTQGRWYDSSLVRWYEGAMTPIGGWQGRITDQTEAIWDSDDGEILGSDGEVLLSGYTRITDADGTGKARSMIAWRANDGSRFGVVGASNGLYVFTPTAEYVTVITPAGFTDGRDDATTAGGYGVGPYGAGAYGVSRPDSASNVIQDASEWTLDTYGQYLVGCMAEDGKIYEWTLNTSNPAVVIEDAPTSCSALVSTSDGFLMVLGAGGNPRAIAWSDRYDEQDFTPDATNQAGDALVQSVGRLMQGKRMRSGTLILTDQEAFLAAYIGLPFVHDFVRVGDNCGAISRNCVAAPDGRAFWMGIAGFFVFDGVSVSQAPCEIYDGVFGNLNVTQRSKVSVWTIANKSEIWWTFPSAGSTECDTIAVFNYKEGHWALHALTRLCGADQGVFNAPMMIDDEGQLYDHEVGADWDGEVPYAESGPAEIGVGETTMRVTQVIFDERTAGDVEVSFLVRNWPTEAETTYGPYASANPTPVRFAGRQVRERVEFQDAGQWGAPRFRVQAGARR